MFDRQRVIDQLSAALGAMHVILDDDARNFFAADFFFEGEPPFAIAAPANVEELREVVKIAKQNGTALVARGGGLSYSGGYVPRDANTLSIDLRRLDRIRDLSVEDLTVTAEAGVTWEQLYTATSAHGLRVVSTGPSTGRFATVGGSLTNNAMFFGAAKAGTVAESVLGMDVVLEDGTLVSTGSASLRNGRPFFRYCGPDLTGLFLADAGIFGLKAAATFALEPIPAGVAMASFAFADHAAMIEAARSIGQTRLASDCLGVGSYVSGGKPTSGPQLHVVTEGLDQAIAQRCLDELKNIAARHGGKETDPVVPAYMRANMFSFAAPLTPSGHLQIWTHGLFPIGSAGAAYRELASYLDGFAADLDRHQVAVSISVALAGLAVLIEPVLIWADAPRPIHRQAMAPLTTEPPGKENPGARGLIQEIRIGLRRKLAEQGAAHMQPGRFYTLGDTLKPETLHLLRRIHALLDADSRLHPGGLGL
ncbi:MAG: FAD-binding oxidoreductase [Rhodobacteraceae bacterium]|nr:FAD-binding oxidoreductase [Paracoccaceae bacterium]